MRVLHLAQFFAPIIGGEERHVSSIARGLAARGHEVEVATLAHPDRPPVLVEGGFTVHSLSGLSQRVGAAYTDATRRHAPPFPDPGLTRALSRIVRDFRPDVVHGHNWMVHSFLPLKSLSGAALVMTLHDYGLACVRKTMMRHDALCEGPSPMRCLPCASRHYGTAVGTTAYFGNLVSGAYERRAVDRFVAVSAAVAQACRLPGGRTPFEVIPTFIPDDVAELGPDTDPRLAALPAEDFILYVGDLNRNKGVGVLLDSYRRLGRSVPPRAVPPRAVPPLVLIGRRCPDMPTDLPANVTVCESWPHAAVMHAWSRCLFGIAPSVWPEACGTIVMEANAVGRPMIASRIGGLQDLVAHGSTGLLVPPGDVEALANAMAVMLADEEARERMGRAALMRAETFKAGAVLPRIERVYAEALRSIARPVPALSEVAL